MTHKELVDLLTGNVQAAVKTQDSRFSWEFVSQHAATARSFAIKDFWIRHKRINPNWLQDIDLYYNENIQDDVDSRNCTVRYTIPPYNTLDGKADGFTFVGNYKGKPFVTFNSIQEYSSKSTIPYMDASKGFIVAVIKNAGYVDVKWKARITSGLKVKALLSDPTDSPRFNIDTDNYPVTQDLLPMMEDFLMKKMSQMSGQPIDMVPNKNDNRVAQAMPYRQQN
jgi:hypothetical protein